jgi:Pentapeptide repeats (8 copies)
MANEEHVALLKQGVGAWNAWRDENPDIRPNLSGANLDGANLIKANLREADLTRADLDGADLSEANLRGADLLMANLTGAKLIGARLLAAYLNGARLRGANLAGANLHCATLVDADLAGADLTGCRIYGVSAWHLKLEGTKQQNLVVTPADEPEITVDNIEVAQFVYLMLNNQNIRKVIDTITSKAVLILGRFTHGRKAVLNALREELRKREYVPILFDFDVPATRDITETVSLLARMARFIIADLTDPSSIPKELEAIVPGLAVPVQPLLEGGSSRPYAMFKDYWKYDWVLPVYRYEGLEPLLATLAEKVIAPAEGKAKALEERRRAFEAELTKPR